MKNFIQTITRSSKFHAIAGVLFILSTSSMWGQVCGNSDNNGPGGDGGQGGGQPIAGDPFVPYTGNEFRHIKDLQVWGGVGECQLSWDRWSNSRLTPGQTYFGTGGSWRHGFQWEMADAGLGSTGLPQMTIAYPDGSSVLFARTASNNYFWRSPANIPEVLTQTTAGNDYYLQRKNGWVYHFTKNVDGSGNVYYLMTDFKDTQQNDYVLTYNASHEVTQVTEPGGRYIQISYTPLSINKVDFTTLASITTTPASGAWTTLTVSNPTAYRYLQYYSAYVGHAMVAEIQFYDTNGNLLTGTPYGTTPDVAGYDCTKAFDGNTGTGFNYTQPNGGFVGIDLGAGNAAVVGSIRFYPLAGNASRMYNPLSTGMFQGSNQAPATVDTISSVSTSDGRSITYNYTAFDDATLPYVYQTLTSVNYDDGAQATYTYGQTFPTTRPLVTSYVDPRYPLPFTKAKTTYFATTTSALGELQTQVNYDSGETLNTLGTQGTHTPTVTAGNGAFRTYAMVNAVQSVDTDSLGHTINFAYDSRVFPNAITDKRGNAWGKTNTTYFNPLTKQAPDGATETWTRDSLDLPLTFKDQLNHTTTIARDTYHRPTNFAYSDGSHETFAYNGFGQVTSHLLRNGFSESALYDSTGLRTSSTDPAGNTTSYGYDSFDRLSSKTDARGYTTQYQYNGKGQVIQITYPDGSAHSYTYDDFGNKLTDTDELGHTTVYTYDTFNRCTSITDALGRKTQYIFRSGYFVENKPDKVIYPSGKVVYNTYDTEDNLLTQTVGYGTADAATTTYTYDANNNVTGMKDPKGNVWSFTYDSRNRKTSQTDPLGHTTSYGYDAASNIVTVTRPDGGVTTNTYDTMHRLLTTTDPKGETTTNTYDASSNLLTTTDARGNTYTFTYDQLNRKTSMKYPDGSAESYGYDAVGNLVTYVTRAGQTKTSTFDNRNREVSYTWSDGTPGVSRTYDAAGRLLSSANGASASTYGYDAANQMLSETETNATAGHAWTMSYAYSADGHRASLTYPSGGVVTYGYTNRNQINSIALGGTSLASYAYDGNGNVVSKTLADNTLASYTYDAANRLTTLNHTHSGTSFARFDYGYDVMNRRTFEQRDSAAGDVYGYDAVDQVTAVNYDATSPSTGTGGADRTVGYTYDATGNRTAVNDNVNGNASYTANNLNEYSNVAGSAYTYDGNGNLLTGNGLYMYDAQNRLGYAQVGSNIDQFAYDSKNRVVERTVNGTPTFFIYDGWDLIEERDGSNNVLATYVHGVRQDEILSMTTPAGTAYYHHNAVGSVADLTNAAGTVVEKYKYDAFGKPAITDGSGNPLTVSTVGNRFMFTGREYLAEVNLYDYRNRVYSADLGRFLQTDPMRFAAGDVNIYRYCGNNPLNLRDESGLEDDGLGPLDTPGQYSNDHPSPPAPPAPQPAPPPDVPLDPNGPQPHLGPGPEPQPVPPPTDVPLDPNGPQPSPGPPSDLRPVAPPDVPLDPNGPQPHLGPGPEPQPVPPPTDVPLDPNGPQPHLGPPPSIRPPCSN